MLTVSPVAKAWPDARSPATTSPVLIPVRTGRSHRCRPELAVELVESRPDLDRRSDGPQGVVLVHDGDTEGGHDRVADELLDDAAVRLDDRADHREVACHHRPDRLGVERLAELGRPAASMNTMVASLRVAPLRADAEETASAVPHSAQNRARSGFSVPQVGHGVMRGRVRQPTRCGVSPKTRLVDEGRRSSRWVDYRPGGGHHRCPAYDTFPVTRGLVACHRRPRHYGRRPLSVGDRQQGASLMNSKHRPGEYADSGEDDTEGQTFKLKATDARRRRHRGPGVQAERDARRRRHRGPGVQAERDARRRRHRGPGFKLTRRPKATTPRARRSS